MSESSRSATSQRKPGEPIKVSSRPRAPAGAPSKPVPKPAAAAAPAPARKPSVATGAPSAASGPAAAAAAASSPLRAKPPAPAAASHATPGPGQLANFQDYSLPPSREEAEAALKAALAAELAQAHQREQQADPRAWQDVRVFVSSTFKDMHGERDCLSKVVFPRLNQEVGKARRMRFTCVDLRWGLTQEETSAAGRGAVLCCLDEIRRCRPWFLCLLGARYGWVPERSYLPGSMSEDDLQRYAWLRRWPLGDSVTELEVWYGLLGAPAGDGAAPRAFAFLRDPSFASAIGDEAGRAVFAADRPERQEALRARVAAHPLCTTATYRCGYAPGSEKGPPSTAGLDDFGAAVFEALRAAAVASRPGGAGEAEGGPLEAERAAQRLLVERLAGRCVGREALADAIADFACGRPVQGGLLKPPPAAAKPAAGAKRGGPAPAPAPASGNVLVVAGRPGSGKTSVMAKAALRIAGERRALIHFVAGTEFGADWPAIQGRLRAELLEAAGLPPHHSGAANRHVPMDRIAAAVPGGIALVIDGANQIEELSGSLAEAVGPLAGDCRLVLSAVEGPAADELARSFGAQRLPVPGLDAALAAAIVKRSLADVGKRLTEGQAAALLKKPDATVSSPSTSSWSSGCSRGSTPRSGACPATRQACSPPSSPASRPTRRSPPPADPAGRAAAVPGRLRARELRGDAAGRQLPAEPARPGGEPGEERPQVGGGVGEEGRAPAPGPRRDGAPLGVLPQPRAAAPADERPVAQAGGEGARAQRRRRAARLPARLRLPLRLVEPGLRGGHPARPLRGAGGRPGAAEGELRDGGRPQSVPQLRERDEHEQPAEGGGGERRAAPAAGPEPAGDGARRGVRDSGRGGEGDDSAIPTRPQVLGLDDTAITAERLLPIVEGARAAGRLRGDGAAPLAECLRLPALERLDVSGNKLASKAMDGLAPSLAGAPSLRALYVDLKCVESGGAEDAQLLRPLAKFAQAAVSLAPALDLYVVCTVGIAAGGPPRLTGRNNVASLSAWGRLGEPLIGVWAGPAGLELRLQEAVGAAEFGRLLVGSLRDPGSGLWALKSALGVPPATAALPLTAARLASAEGAGTPPGREGQARVALLEGAAELELAWGPAGAPEDSLARARLRRVLPQYQ